VMKTIILPSGNAFGVDDNNGFTALGRNSQTLSRNSVLGVDHSNRAQVGNSWRSPRNQRPFSRETSSIAQTSVRHFVDQEVLPNFSASLPRLQFLPDTAACSLGLRRSTEGIGRWATILVLIPMGEIVAAAQRSVEEDDAKDPTRNRLAVLLSRTNHMSYHLG
jgi:hypothetical protein